MLLLLDCAYTTPRLIPNARLHEIDILGYTVYTARVLNMTKIVRRTCTPKTTTIWSKYVFGFKGTAGVNKGRSGNYFKSKNLFRVSSRNPHLRINLITYLSRLIDIIVRIRPLYSQTLKTLFI